VLLGGLIVWSQWRQWRQESFGYRQETPEFVLVIAFALSFAGLYGLRELAWSAPALAVAGFVFCWLAGKSQARSYRVATTAWLAAGALALLLAWPNEPRHGAVEFLGGLGMVLQGVWGLIQKDGGDDGARTRDLRRDRPAF
jgi:hypothetical protein